MPLENNEGDTLLTGSTFGGEPVVVGGVYYTSGGTSTPAQGAAYVQTFLLDPSGAVYITMSGTVPTAPAPGTLWPTGPTQVYTSGLQGVSGAVSVANWPATLGVTASAPLPVVVNNWPATLGVSASVQLPVFSSGPVGVTASATLPVAQQGQISVNNFPATQNVSGNVNLGNWPATIGVTASAPLPAVINNWPAVHGVSSSSPSGFWSNGAEAVSGSQLTGSTFNGYPVVVGGVYPVSSTGAPQAYYVRALGLDPSGSVYVTSTGSLAVAPGDGAVFPVAEQNQLKISNFPATQNVSGNVNLGNWPAIIGVSASSPSGFWDTGGTFVSGTVGVNNFPAVQAVSGSQLTGSTFIGYPVVMGGVDNQGYVRGIQTDPNGAVYVTTNPSGNAIEVQGLVASGSTIQGNPVPVAGVDPTGVVRALDVDSFGRLVIAPAGTNVTNGFVVGTISTAAKTNVAIRASTYNEQSSNAQRSVSSANAADVNTTGTGAWKVTITYYDQNYNGPFNETVNLNGTTAVNTVSTTMCFIEKIVVSTVGTGGSNVGAITLFVGTGGTGGTLGIVNAGDNRTFWAHHYTPNGKSTYITDFTGNNDNSSNYTLFTIRAKASGSSAPDLQVSDYLVEGGGVAQTQRSYGTPIIVAGPARVVVWGAPNTTATTTSRASFDFYDQ